MAQQKQTPGAGRTRKSAGPEAPTIKILTLDEIEEVDDLPERDIPVPEWGKDVGIKVKALTKQQQIDIRKQATVNGVVDEDMADLYAIVYSCIDPVLTVDQVGMLKMKNGNAIDRISVELVKLNMVSGDALDAMEAAFRALTG